MSILDHLLGNYGYAAVAVGVGGESLGLPLPGETVLIAAATYAGASHRLAPAAVVLVAAVAAIVGDNLGYLIGRSVGTPLMARLDRRPGGRSARIRSVQEAFDRHRSSVVVVGRFVSIMRTYAAFLAGVQRMPWRRFLVLNALGGAAWAAVIGFGAAALGAGIGQSASYVLTAALVVGFVLITVVTRRTRRRRSAAADHHPGLADHLGGVT